MSRLNKVARARIKASGLTIAEYVRYHFDGVPGERVDAIWGRRRRRVLPRHRKARAS